MFAKFYPSNRLNSRHLRNYQCLDICDDCYSSQFGFLTSQNGWKDERRHGRNGTFRTARTCTRTHGIRTYTHQRRTTLVVDLQDKYYSEKLDYRYRPPPNANSCASADRPNLTNTHVTCVHAYESAPEKLSRLSPQSSSPPTFNLSLFSSRCQTAIPHEFSVYHNHTE